MQEADVSIIRFLAALSLDKDIIQHNSTFCNTFFKKKFFLAIRSFLLYNTFKAGLKTVKKLDGYARFRKEVRLMEYIILYTMLLLLIIISVKK